MNILNHVCFIPDANRRFAEREGISYAEAYQKGASRAVEATIWCKEIGVRHVSFFGLSMQNMLERPESQMISLREGVLHFCRKISSTPGVTLHIVGDPNCFNEWPQRDEILRLRDQGGWTGNLVVHASIGYSGEAKYEIPPLLEAVRDIGYHAVEMNPRGYILSAGVPDVDLMIRTGGRNRLSGMLPFQMAYAELKFVETFWSRISGHPIFWADFTRPMFDKAIQWYHRQVRTKGE